MEGVAGVPVAEMLCASLLEDSDALGALDSAITKAAPSATRSIFADTIINSSGVLSE